jgi:hypothetical protein
MSVGQARIPSVLRIWNIRSTIGSKSGVLVRRLGNIVGSTAVLRSDTAILRRRSSVDLGIVVLLCIASGVVWHGLDLRWWWATRKTVVAMTSWSKGYPWTNTLRTVATSECDLGAVLVATEGDEVLTAEVNVSHARCA